VLLLNKNFIPQALQNFMFGMLKDSNARAVKMSLVRIFCQSLLLFEIKNANLQDIMIQLYKKNIWNDTKTVNVLSTACYSKFPKVKVAALKFFVGKDPEEKDSDSDSDEVLFNPFARFI
jgi:protein SDA1